MAECEVRAEGRCGMPGCHREMIFHHGPITAGATHRCPALLAGVTAAADIVSQPTDGPDAGSVAPREAMN